MEIIWYFIEDILLFNEDNLLLNGDNLLLQNKLKVPFYNAFRRGKNFKKVLKYKKF